MFLTGTIAPQFEDLIWEKLNLQDSPSTTVIRAHSTQRLNISYQVISARIKAAFHLGMTEREKDAIKEEWKRQLPLLQFLINHLQPGEKGLFFIRIIEKVEWWAEQLSCPYIHGHVTRADRIKIWNDWHAGITPFIVTNKASASSKHCGCTQHTYLFIIGAYGVDDPDVRFTVHIEDPMSLTEFTQGSGHAGRNGLTALSLIILPFDYKRVKPGEDNYEGEVSMSKFLSTKECRRQVQSNFLDGQAMDCTGLYATLCDVCQRAGQPVRGNGWDALVEKITREPYPHHNLRNTEEHIYQFSYSKSRQPSSNISHPSNCSATLELLIIHEPHSTSPIFTIKTYSAKDTTRANPGHAS
jgi:superfamily II DNA helicase RecQ